ncbi:FHA domain-containing protein [Pseudoduganella lutea]|uniref:YscD cytoplasmic domain-containing protein n=1 Tax=Pseudoduganella lutea TaxID=321985 RepID=A0A4P6KTF2_9BURK|nr:FHA domain-containing protein [Pseudoduganella lutea]QBE61944.1 hypothetical protein EWM63_02170 [Pseudoduganella lutea]
MSAAFPTPLLPPLPTPCEALGARLRPLASPPGGADPAGAIAAPLFDLRVLNGAQKDAVVSLGAGRLLIGNDLECDIVLHRPGVVLRAMLSLVDGRLSIAAMSGPLHLNQVAIAAGESRTVVHGDTIRLADIGLLLTDHEPGAVGPAFPPTDGADAGADTPTDAATTPSPAAAEDTHWFDPTPASAPAPQPMAAVASRARGARFALAGATACLLLACACVAAWDVEAVDDSANYSMPAEASRVSAADAPALPAAPMSPARVLAEAREVLEARRIQGELAMPVGRLLVLTVAPERIAAARAALGALLSDVNGIDRVEVRLRGNGASPGAAPLSARRGPDGIVIDDNLPLPAEAVFSGKNRIVIVSMQPMPSILTQGGRRLFQGGQLDARTTVEHIHPTSVLVTIDGAKRRVVL